MRRKTAESVCCEACCTAIIKKKKPESSDEYIRSGIVSIRSSDWTAAARQLGNRIPYVEYRGEPGRGVPRIKPGRKIDPASFTTNVHIKKAWIPEPPPSSLKTPPPSRRGTPTCSPAATPNA